MMEVLDLFSAAAGGWSLGMHRAGFRTIAACEAVEWRRILYAQNNPGIPIYDDVRTLTAERLLHDLGRLPPVIVGSPPCQDISSANTKGKGVEGERSGLFFEAVRIIGECRPRWFALENSANLRTRGADAVLAALEALGYTCWPLVVRAGDIGANHERPRCWLVGCDVAQVTYPPRDGEHAQSVDGEVAELRWLGRNCSGDATDAHEDEIRQPELSRGAEQKAAIIGQPGHARDVAVAVEVGQEGQPGAEQPRQGEVAEHAARDGGCDASVPDQAGWRENGQTSGARILGEVEGAPPYRTHGGCEPGRSAETDNFGQMAIRPADSGDLATGEPLWSLADLAGRLWLDDGLPARVAGTRVAVGGPRGTAAASLIVEAYGDAVVPQIPEAIGRAMLRVEEAMLTVQHAGEARAV